MDGERFWGEVCGGLVTSILAGKGTAVSSKNRKLEERKQMKNGMIVSSKTCIWVINQSGTDDDLQKNLTRKLEKGTWIKFTFNSNTIFVYTTTPPKSTDYYIPPT